VKGSLKKTCLKELERKEKLEEKAKVKAGNGKEKKFNV
jgi:hypothetical protein